MATAQKKVILRRFIGETLFGYLPSSGFVRREGDVAMLDLLDPGGHLISLALADVRTIFYVRDFNLGDPDNPERLSRRTFLARPRAEGLWVRLTLRGGEILEGLAAADLGLLCSIIEDAGLHLTPPDTRSNTQRLFVPRTAIADLQVVAVITTPSRKKPLPAPETPSLQESLFATTDPHPLESMAWSSQNWHAASVPPSTATRRPKSRVSPA